MQPGAFYVADRLYSDDYAFLGRMLRQRIDFCQYACRAMRCVSVPRPGQALTAQDRAAGVVSDPDGATGSQKHKGLVIRVVEIHAAGQVFVLGTSRRDLPAELIGLIYRYRWQIELFFKWFKMILGGTPLAGRIPSRRSHPTLQRPDCDVAFDDGHGPTPDHPPVGNPALVLCGLCQRGGIAAGTGSAKKLNHRCGEIAASDLPCFSSMPIRQTQKPPSFIFRFSKRHD